MQAPENMVEVVPHGTAPVLDVFGAPLSVLSEGGAAGPLVGEQAVPPGYGVPPHVHDEDDELFYLLEGELTVAGPEGETVARAGACVRLPRGVPHGFRNDGAAPARFMVVVTPGRSALAMFREFDRLPRGAAPNPAEIAAIAARHGVRFV